MSNAPPVLDLTLIGALESRLRARCVPVDEWKPGLDNSEIVEILAPVGLSLPIEGRVLWGWHDGAPGEGMDNQLGPVGPCFLDLASAVECYKDYRQVVTDIVERDLPPLDDPDFRWSSTWLPFVGWQLPAVLDCAVEEGMPSPVRVISMEDPLGSAKPIADSLGEVFERWIHALDVGAWQWQVDRSEWTRHSERLDQSPRASGLL